MTAPWHVSVITLFPDAFPGILSESLVGKAHAENRWRLTAHDLRSHGRGKHRAVDDTPSGGGPGMVLRADVLADAIDTVAPETDQRPRICLSARGRPLTQARVRQLAEGPGAVLVCGRFEGIDERVIKARALEEISIGDIILAGGEVAAMALIEACVRLIPGVMGAFSSGDEESFENGLLEYPHYTRPRDFEGFTIPEVLTCGDHEKVARWRQDEAERLTQSRRPDLWAARPKNRQ